MRGESTERCWNLSAQTRGSTRVLTSGSLSQWNPSNKTARSNQAWFKAERESASNAGQDFSAMRSGQEIAQNASLLPRWLHNTST